MTSYVGGITSAVKLTRRWVTRQAAGENSYSSSHVKVLDKRAAYLQALGGCETMIDPACHKNLRRYWFKLDKGLGIGVPAPSEAEAWRLAEDTRRVVHPSARIVGVIPDIRMDELDHNHVLPNIGLVVVRGVEVPEPKRPVNE